MNSDFDPAPPPSGDCPDSAQLSRLLEESLSPDDEAALSSHLQHCPRCQNQLEVLAADSGSWAEAGELLSAAASVVPPEPALLNAVARLEGRSDRQEPDDTLDLAFLAPARRPGDLGALDHYDILSVVGRGGMGVVFKAHDTLLERVVAVKVLAPTLAVSAAARQRFIREAQAAAAVAHDHVVTIHAVEPKNIPYLVMQFVAGVSLEEKIRATGPLEVKEILRIGMQTAAGLAAAHAQGLIHRDVKPANILLENGIQRVKITDFGLARLVDDAGMTQTGVIAGTPQYMSPEQVRGERLDCRSDLFSLGSVLYAMCTGQGPFGAGSNMAVLRKVADEQPPAIGGLNPAIPAELVAVIAKLHSKDPSERFQSASEVSQLLAEQLARLQSEGGSAPSMLGDWPARRPEPAVDLLAANLARLRPRRRWAIWLPVVIAMLSAAGVYHFATAHRQSTTVQNVAAPAGARAERPLESPIVCVGHAGAVREVIFSPDAATAISAGEDKTIYQWDTETGQLLRKFTGHEAGIQTLAISPDAQRLASASDDGSVMLWDMATGNSKLLPRHEHRVYSLAFSPDGQTLASAGDDRVIRLWRLESGDERTFAEDPATLAIRRLLFAPDGNTLISAGQLITFWDVAQGKPRQSFAYAHTAALQWDTDAQFLAAASWLAGLVTLFDPADGRQIAVWQPHDSALEDIALWPRQKLMFTVGEDGMVRAWQPLRQQLRSEWRGHAGRIRSVALAPSAGLLATAGKDDSMVKIWNVSQIASAPPASPRPPQPLAPATLRHTLSGHTGPVLSIAFSPDGDTLASAGQDTAVRMWNAHTGEPGEVLRGHEREVLSLAFSPDGITLASAGGDSQHGDVLFWDVKSASQTGSLPGNPCTVFDVAFSPNGKTLATGGHDRLLRLYDVGERKEIATLKSRQKALARRLLFADDGRTLLAGGDVLSMYDVVDRSHRLDVPHDETSDMKLSPRGDLLAASAWQVGRITLFEFPSLQPRLTWRAHREALQAVAFSPDGRYLASTSTDSTAKIWQVADGRLRAVLLSPLGDLYAVAFSPDGQTLAASNDETPFNVYLWDVSSLK